VSTLTQNMHTAGRRLHVSSDALVLVNHCVLCLCTSPLCIVCDISPGAPAIPNGIQHEAMDATDCDTTAYPSCQLVSSYACIAMCQKCCTVSVKPLVAGQHSKQEPVAGERWHTEYCPLACAITRVGISNNSSCARPAYAEYLRRSHPALRTTVNSRWPPRTTTSNA
jgi:hypothetical protein